jgi:hypothetical protein
MRNHFRQKYNKPITTASANIDFNESDNKAKRIKAVQIATILRRSKS